MSGFPSIPRLFRILDVGGASALSSLNIKPTLWLGTPVFLFFLLFSAFLEYYVVAPYAPNKSHARIVPAWEHASSPQNLPTSAQMIIFLVGSYTVFSSYFVANFYMLKHSTSYAAIPDDKKFYVLSNILKSAVLFAYCPIAAKTLKGALLDGVWSTARIHNLGILYAIPDTVSMLLVQRMATSTKVHHLCVLIFGVVNLFCQYEEETVARALVVYAIFSTFAYAVNLLLATRFLPIAPCARLFMSILALVVYAACLSINWSWQLAFLWRLARVDVTMPMVAYVCLIALVVVDDCILLKWLWKNVVRTAEGMRTEAHKDKAS